MRRGRQAKTLWMAALIPLFFAVILPGQIRTLVCRVSGAVMGPRCCPSETDGSAARQATAVEAQLRGEDCCAIKAIDLARLVSDRRPETAPPRQHELCGTVSVGVVPNRPHRDAALVRIVSPPPIGPPIVLLKRAFLI